jgi:hypothetical protein
MLTPKPIKVSPWNAGVTAIMSGACELPALNGSLVTKLSPGLSLSTGYRSSTLSTAC